MLDLLHFVQEDGQIPHEGADPGLQKGTSDLGRPPSSDEALHGTPLKTTQSAPAHSLSKAPSKGAGLLAKCKNLRNRRRSQGSDTADEDLQRRRSSSGAEGSSEFSPLGAGGYGDGRGQNGAAAQHSESEQTSMAGQEAQSSTFMERMRAYRSRRGGSKVGDSFEEGGPLQKGMRGGGRRTLNEPGQRGEKAGAADAAGMKEFFAGVTEAKALLADVTERQRRISATREASRTLADPSQLREAQQQVQEGIDEVTLVCKRVKVKLDELDLINADLLGDEESEEEGDDAALHPQLQMRLSVMAGLNARLSEVTGAWQQMRAEWQQEDQAEVARQLHTVTGREFPPEEVEDLVQNGGSEAIYRQALTSVNGATVRQLMSDVQERHDQIRQLEASMLELHQVFLDMSILVADQGDTINSIDNWVSSTAATMRQSLVELRAAKAYRRKAAQTKAVTFVTGVGLVAGGAGLTATGVGAVAGVPMMVAGAAAIGGSAIGGIT